MPYNRREFIRNSGLIAGSAAFGLQSNEKLQNLGYEEADRLVLLGTQGGPFIRSYKPSPSASLIVYKNLPIVIDTGHGVTFKLIEAGIALPSIKYIFITHHHSDHNLDLGPLLYNSWIAGLQTNVNVYAPVGLQSMIASYWEYNRFDIETRIADEGRPDIRKLVTCHEYTEGSNIMSNTGVVVSALRNIHPPIKESYALKFKLDEKIIVFSGDTAYCPALAEFAAGADYLVHEVMYGPAIDALTKRRPNAAKLKESILSHHTLAEDVGRIASQAKVKNLVLSHFVPADDKSVTDKVWTDAVSSNFTGNIIVGKDLLKIPF
jgi:ribonuclease BN (tRNA processing enzyme)